MSRWMIIWVLLLTSCGPEKEQLLAPPPDVPADYFTPCAGYTGGKPTSNEEFGVAAASEKRGRLCANRKLDRLKQIYGPQ